MLCGRLYCATSVLIPSVATCYEAGVCESVFEPFLDVNGGQKVLLHCMKGTLLRKSAFKRLKGTRAKFAAAE